MHLHCYNKYVKIFANTFVDENPEKVLKLVFGYNSFRPYQKEIIEEVLKGNDVLAIMPTGGGKSICYQIPALILDGITIVVSPLISLMQNQVEALVSAGIESVFLNSTLSPTEYTKATENIRNGKIKIVYVSPEGLATKRIRDIFANSELKVSCITVDEAHCVSEWGHDFRPNYMEIFSIRQLFPNSVMLALTATATVQVRQDIIKNLRLKKPTIFISSFNRSNIFLDVKAKKNPVDQVLECLKDHQDESGIIYCFSRKQVDELTEKLDRLGYSVVSYHAGLTDEMRQKNQDLFIKDQVQIIVATVAFGMGIDKPNVRYVINFDLPKSLEEYYQEIGRAGRDGLPSYALLLYSPGDIHKIKYFFTDMYDSSKAEILLNNMISFATSTQCRRKTLLKYFNEEYIPSEKTKECCCDICLNGEKTNCDATIPVQKLLCCIIRTREKFGATYIIDILLGSRQKWILENGHNMISTWGIGKELGKDEWFELIELLILQNYLRKEGDYHILEITSKGREFLATRERIFLPIEIHSTNINYSRNVKTKRAEFIIHKKGEQNLADSGVAGDEKYEKIIEELKKWRKRKSEDLNVPPYVIFGDKTLIDLANKKPNSKQSLMNVYGIGSAKAESFGKILIEIISNC